MAANGAQEQTDSFWNIDGFKRTVRRTEDGMQQCHELMKLMQERADIEKDYAKRIRVWAKKWTENIEKGSEYGTTKVAMKGCMEAADRLAEVHVAVKDRILNAVQIRLKDWKNENYKKHILGGCREAKSFEDDFHKAQKPWAKKHDKVTKAKRDYHNACRQERAAAAHENSLRLMAEGPTPDQIRKAQERTEKCRKEMLSSKLKYSSTLLDLKAVNGSYMENMAEVFERTQSFEQRRIDFIKMILTEFHNALDLSQNAMYVDVYTQIRQTINKADVGKDLLWWSQTYGTGMPMNSPSFEECPGDSVPVDRSEKAPPVATGTLSNGATLAGAAVASAPLPESTVSYGNAAPVPAPAETPQYASVRYKGGSSAKDTGTYRSSMSAASDRSDSSQNAVVVSRPASAAVAVSRPTSAAIALNAWQRHHHEGPTPSARSNSATSDDNPFNDIDEFSAVGYNEAETESPQYENEADITLGGTNTLYEEIPAHSSAAAAAAAAAGAGGGGGVQVCALYDYHAVEEDELTFNAGDVFLMIKDVDAQGWCTGLKDGVVGLYPESYAQPC